MFRNRIIFSTFLLFSMLSAMAIPARKTDILLTQPDGSTFMSVLHGDEFFKIRQTAEGHAIMQGRDGWWYYAVYDQDGLRSSSGYKVGQDVPSGIISRSMMIPYEKIAERASLKRSETARLPMNAAVRWERGIEANASEPIISRKEE